MWPQTCVTSGQPKKTIKSCCLPAYFPPTVLIRGLLHGKENTLLAVFYFSFLVLLHSKTQSTGVRGVDGVIANQSAVVS